CANQIQHGATNLVADVDVERRRWLPFDFDPTRGAGTSSTAAELDAARLVMEAVRAFLDSKGWPSPVVGMSGNGWHLLYPIDLPNTVEVTAAVQAVIDAVAHRFSTAAVKV